MFQYILFHCNHMCQLQYRPLHSDIHFGRQLYEWKLIQATVTMDKYSSYLHWYSFQAHPNGRIMIIFLPISASTHVTHLCTRRTYQCSLIIHSINCNIHIYLEIKAQYFVMQENDEFASYIYTPHHPSQHRENQFRAH